MYCSKLIHHHQPYDIPYKDKEGNSSTEPSWIFNRATFLLTFNLTRAPESLPLANGMSLHLIYDSDQTVPEKFLLLQQMVFTPALSIKARKARLSSFSALPVIYQGLAPSNSFKAPQRSPGLRPQSRVGGIR